MAEEKPNNPRLRRYDGIRAHARGNCAAQQPSLQGTPRRTVEGVRRGTGGRTRRRQGFHRPGCEADDRPVQARRGRDAHVAGLLHVVAEHHEEGHGRRIRTGGGSSQVRQPLPQRALAEQPGFRLHQAVLPDRRAEHPEDRLRSRRPRRADCAQGEVLHPPVRGRAGPDQFRDDQSRGAEDHGRDRGEEPARRSQPPAPRPRTRPRQAGDQHDRLQGVQDGRKRRHHARERSSTRTI